MHVQKIKPHNQVCFLLQYFEYTSQKEIRFNSVTELCAEVPDGQTSIGMRHCPRDGEVRPPNIIWEFREVKSKHIYTHKCTLSHSSTNPGECMWTYIIPCTVTDLILTLIYISLKIFSGWNHLPPSLRHVCDSLPHNRGPHRHPDEPVQPRRQKPAVEVWVVGGRREN